MICVGAGIWVAPLNNTLGLLTGATMMRGWFLSITDLKGKLSGMEVVQLKMLRDRFQRTR